MAGPRSLITRIGGTSAAHARAADVDTGLILNAFSVRGEARNVTAGGLAARSFGPVGALGGFSNTPVEEAVRKALLEAVKEIALRMPEDYFGPRSDPPQPDEEGIIETGAIGGVQDTGRGRIR